MDDDFIVLNEALIRLGMKRGIGIKRAAIRLLGERLSKGWIDRLIGRKVECRRYVEFVRIGTGRAPTNDEIYELSTRRSTSFLPSGALVPLESKDRFLNIMSVGM